ncbi:MAG: hypothetical protein UT78_C0009G0020 [Candidatus Nomurabacteria bacterium GW2011_GWF2_40_12]|uniref:EfeO-type cupredoxin-like domain-containing protein n=1 Tax=Candidatus Nomurabacteria bacterium GW2011_GWF2_40_12 TaxID=1618776 RepID=A0A0G0T7H3_9BACT|nr:MAG: hypothetical protein UT78_C0009G0020 [Candidatus Nomurabacteria bacterium GW2011_GWF2_40_12]
MNKIASIILTLGLVVAIGIVFWGGKENSKSVQNVEIKDGIQYITIDAKGGYSPRLSTAKAGIPTKLIVKTDGTYDCSSSLVVRAAGFQKLLPQTGETEIDLGIPEAGVPIEGVCGMGMYSFNVNFQN